MIHELSPSNRLLNLDFSWPSCCFKIHRKLAFKVRVAGLDFNPRPPEYKTGVLTTRPRRSVSFQYYPMTVNILSYKFRTTLIGGIQRGVRQRAARNKEKVRSLCHSTHNQNVLVHSKSPSVKETHFITQTCVRKCVTSPKSFCKKQTQRFHSTQHEHKMWKSCRIM